jgi:hypothetical protein
VEAGDQNARENPRVGQTTKAHDGNVVGLLSLEDTTHAR